MIAAPAKVREVKENIRSVNMMELSETNLAFPLVTITVRNSLRKKNLFILVQHIALISKYTVLDPTGKVKKIYD